jgi:hypothetical protein
MAPLEGLGQLEQSSDLSGIEPATLRLVAQDDPRLAVEHDPTTLRPPYSPPPGSV